MRDFPLWGSGYGTYQCVDVLHLGFDAGMIVDHAHNDYLETLVEGGLALFLPVVVAVVLVFRLGLRAVRRHEDRPTGGLVLGALVAFTTVAIHSFSDFGMHIPANAAIVTVLCAQLCTVGRRRGGRTGDRGRPRVRRLGSIRPAASRVGSGPWGRVGGGPRARACWRRLEGASGPATPAHGVRP